MLLLDEKVNKRMLSECKVGDWVFSTTEKLCFKLGEVNIDFIKRELDTAANIFIPCQEPKM